MPFLKGTSLLASQQEVKTRSLGGMLFFGYCFPRRVKGQKVNRYPSKL